MNWRILFFSRDETLIADVPVTQAQAEALLADAGIPKAEAVGSCFPVHGWLEATDTPDPIAEAEHAVVIAAEVWADDGWAFDAGDKLHEAIAKLHHLRAAQASQGSGT